jgi:hypothetical protein
MIFAAYFEFFFIYTMITLHIAVIIFHIYIYLIIDMTRSKPLKLKSIVEI